MDLHDIAQALTRRRARRLKGFGPRKRPESAHETTRHLLIVGVAGALALLALDAEAALARTPHLHDGSDGATCEYFNFGARIAWRNRLGDWRDANGTAQGEQPFAQSLIRATDADRVVQWDVTGLVREWQVGRVSNQGIAVFALRERDS